MIAYLAALVLTLALSVAFPRVTVSTRSTQMSAQVAVLVLRLAPLALPRKHNTSLHSKSEAGDEAPTSLLRFIF